MIGKRIERRRFLAGGMVALGAALLAGCAGKPGGEESRDGQSPAEETAVTVLMPGPAARKDKTRSSGFSALTRKQDLSRKEIDALHALLDGLEAKDDG